LPKTVTCEKCNGSGKIKGYVCQGCKGRGLLPFDYEGKASNIALKLIMKDWGEFVSRDSGYGHSSSHIYIIRDGDGNITGYIDEDEYNEDGEEDLDLDDLL